MTTLLVFLVILLQITNLSLAQDNCIPLEDCPDALKYVQKRRYDPETITILRNAHCGTYRENKILCNRVPHFEDLPAGCVSISECPAAIELKGRRKNDPDAAQLLSDVACGYSGRKDMVMCDNLVPKIRAIEPNKTDLLPKQNECGLQAPVPRITHGERANFEDLPWLALLGYKNKSGVVIYRCHGSLISQKYVVTAAHCLKYPKKEKTGELHKIILGEYDTTTTQDCLSSSFGGYCMDPIQEFSPESIHVHPNFESPDGVSDIGLVRLNKNAVYTEFVRPICIPLDSVRLKRHDSLMIGGWGKTENNQPSKIKLKAVIKYLSHTQCSRFNIDHTQICAGSTTGADTCKGDSGGPLMAIRQNEDHEIKSILVGVVSFGGRCGSGSAVYTNVSLFVRWILDTIHE